MKIVKLTKILCNCFVITGLCFLCLTNVNALTNEEISNEDYLINNTSPEDLDLSKANGTIYTDEYLDELNEAYARVYKTANSLTRAGTNWVNRTLGVTTYKQDNNYYCGPANIKQVVQFINGSSESQSTYANRMGTNSSSGTLVYKMRDELNYRQSYNNYVYQQMNSSSYDAFLNIVKGNIFYGNDTTIKGKPIIIHAKTGSLYLYNGNNIGHYLTINGFHDGTKKTTYVDPWEKDYGRGSTLGQHQDTATNVFNTVSGSRYVIY